MRNTILSKLVLFAFGLFVSFSAIGQNTIEMADTMRSNGKIYVVVAVLMTVLTGVITYLVYIDRKISKIEKETSR